MDLSIEKDVTLQNQRPHKIKILSDEGIKKKKERKKQNSSSSGRKNGCTNSWRENKLERNIIKEKHTYPKAEVTKKWQN